MQKEELMLQKRLIELSRLADQRGIVTYSDFLNLNELNILHTMPKTELYAAYKLFGGYEYSERQMAAFLPDAFCYEYFYPISILRIQPLQKKFSETLSHRDYLGAILNLGIERSKIGDILVREDNTVLFVHNSLEAFVTEELRRIRHTAVMVTAEDMQDFSYQPNIEEKKEPYLPCVWTVCLRLRFLHREASWFPILKAAKSL